MSKGNKRKDIFAECIPSEPSGLWSHYHMTVDFDEEKVRKVYWSFRNDPELADRTDDELKDAVAGLYEFANVIAHITWREMAKQQAEESSSMEQQ